MPKPEYRSRKRDIVYQGYVQWGSAFGDKPNDEYANEGYKMITKLPIGAEFTVVRGHDKSRVRYRVDVDRERNDGKKYLFEVIHSKSDGTYIRSAATTSLIEERKRVLGFTPTANIRRMVGNNAEQIIFHNNILLSF